MSLFLGVDGGGTKTALVLLIGHGEVAARQDAPSCYYLGLGSTAGVDLVSQVLADAVPAVCAAAGVQPGHVDYAFFGLPTYGEVSGDVAALDAAPRAALGHGHYRCDNDMVCGWAGSLGLADGINVISGTGSMAYGQRGHRQARIGGWGELFGDEGSGYWVGLAGLRAFAQMSDGRRAAGPLLDLVRNRLRLASDLDLVDLVLNRWRGSRREVAGLSRLVVDAAELGDAAASQILDQAVAELLRLVDEARLRLGFAEDEAVPVSYSGGMFSVAQVREPFTRRLHRSAHNYLPLEPQYAPVLGAALYAARLAGSPLTPSAMARLRNY